MIFLEKLGFRPTDTSGRNWLWQDIFFIAIRQPDDKDRFGKTTQIVVLQATKERIYYSRVLILSTMTTLPINS